MARLLAINKMRHAYVDDNVETTVAIGLVQNAAELNGVYVLKTIDTEDSPTKYDEVVKCIAATMNALRGQYEQIESYAPGHARRVWFNLARCLTYASGERHILYKINPMNGLPSFVYCNIPNNVEHPELVRGNKYMCAELYEKLQTNDWHQNQTSPYQAFSTYGNLLEVPLDGPEYVSGFHFPLVADQHMKLSDSPDLQWLNVAMHMVTKETPPLSASIALSDIETSSNTYSDIIFDLSTKSTVQSSIVFASQIMSPYPVQWSTSDAGLTQAMEIAAIKLVGHDNYKKYLEEQGSAMNVIMGAAYFVMRPQTNQMHLKTMYTQDDKVMPLASGNAAFVRDITPTGVRNRYLQALMLLGVG